MFLTQVVVVRNSNMLDFFCEQDFLQTYLESLC